MGTPFRKIPFLQYELRQYLGIQYDEILEDNEQESCSPISQASMYKISWNFEVCRGRYDQTTERCTNIREKLAKIAFEMWKFSQMWT